MASDSTPRDEKSRFSLSSLATLLLLGVLGFSFAIHIVLNRLATTNGVPFVPYVFWQTIGAGVVLLAICAVARRLPPLTLPHIRLFLISGALNLALPYTLFSFIAPKLPSSILSLGLSLVPVMIYGLALIARLDRFHGLRFGGILLGLAGVLLVLIPRASLPSPEMAGWVLLGFVPPLCYALNAIAIALLRPPATGSLPLATGMILCASIYMFVVMAVSGSWWAFGGSFGTGHWATLGAMLNNCFTFYLVFEIIKRAGPVIFSTVNYIATLMGMGFGIWFFGDDPSTWIWAALALMFAGLFFVNFTGRRRTA